MQIPEELKQEHDLITQQYYVLGLLTKEEFERLHLENSIKQKELLNQEAV